MFMKWHLFTPTLQNKPPVITSVPAGSHFPLQSGCREPLTASHLHNDRPSTQAGSVCCLFVGRMCLINYSLNTLTTFIILVTFMSFLLVCSLCAVRLLEIVQNFSLMDWFEVWCLSCVVLNNLCLHSAYNQNTYMITRAVQAKKENWQSKFFKLVNFLNQPRTINSQLCHFLGVTRSFVQCSQQICGED